MISLYRQEELLQQFTRGTVRVHTDGTIEKWLSASVRWKPVIPVKKGASWQARYKINGFQYDYPVGVIHLLWKLRRIVSPDAYIGYEDSNPDNLHPDNACLWNSTDYFAWCESRRAAVQTKG